MTTEATGSEHIPGEKKGFGSADEPGEIEHLRAELHAHDEQDEAIGRRSPIDLTAKPKIDLRDLRYEIDGRAILNGITLQVVPGEVLCVMGLSGSGKSTLTRCIAGLARPTAGEIRIDDDEITRLKEDDLVKVRAKMGVVFQYAALFDSMTVFENIAFGILRGPRRQENRKLPRPKLMRMVAERLHQVGLPGIEKRMPSQLSGGQRRRVGLARALATNPEIVLYDEPTSGLDPVTAAAIDQLILSTRDQNNVTSIVVSHDMGSIWRIADRVLMLYEGHVQIYGTPEEVLDSKDPIVRQFILGEVEGPIQTARRRAGNRSGGDSSTGGNSVSPP